MKYLIFALTIWYLAIGFGFSQQSQLKENDNNCYTTYRYSE